MRMRAGREIALGAAHGSLGCRVSFRRGKEHAGTTRLGKPDRDDLLGRSRAVPALPYMANLLLHEFPGLGTG
jgi:hypothetical protein